MFVLSLPVTRRSTLTLLFRLFFISLLKEFFCNETLIFRTFFGEGKNTFYLSLKMLWTSLIKLIRVQRIFLIRVIGQIIDKSCYKRSKSELSAFNTFNSNWREHKRGSLSLPLFLSLYFKWEGVSMLVQVKI